MTMICRVSRSMVDVRERSDIHRWFPESLSCNDHKYPSITTSIPCSWTISIELSSFTTLITSQAYPNVRNLGDWLCWCPTETDGMSLPVADFAISTNSCVMEVSLVTLWKVSSISIGRYWSGWNNSRNSSSVDCHSLLLL